ncbi:hypothetical protein JHS3_08060 [Jeongeupia sp. HS-3]|uniref:hypothetical protein n=1 Tax=Jeongeupia sp. HS-3 TaxID=1009682 RepID=UPI0018A5D4AC|nr:hypothetical protein [Jeongeupia sp. HS-3]BCL75070.1 hypothetical protein JHS3_08060 [Jeongeupia sp. HS-3]
MHFDSTHFPIVWMQQQASATTSTIEPFEHLDQLLSRQQAFVFVTTDMPGAPEADSEQGRASLKQASLWMKQNKPAIRKWIKASIVIVPDSTRRVEVDAFSETFEKFWGYPLLSRASQQEALVLAESLLVVSTAGVA